MLAGDFRSWFYLAVFFMDLLLVVGTAYTLLTLDISIAPVGAPLYFIFLAI